ncbi:hypothetical protein AMATHDRAFT_3125 [Amanita thiersii Skay4041]|uniref:Uncharacterized protein n=1 Tax=Amanita thiersii Skay4041 TaxID=703135 RepID=A0A2A9NME1_9AGAR|nr:hypothetical protein AMATHDRAFT_3125 [Amanita thiersii Skay4041]
MLQDIKDTGSPAVHDLLYPVPPGVTAGSLFESRILKAVSLASGITAAIVAIWQNSQTQCTPGNHPCGLRLWTKFTSFCSKLFRQVKSKFIKVSDTSDMILPMTTQDVQLEDQAFQRMDLGRGISTAIQTHYIPASAHQSTQERQVHITNKYISGPLHQSIYPGPQQNSTENTQNDHQTNIEDNGSIISTRSGNTREYITSDVAAPVNQGSYGTLYHPLWDSSDDDTPDNHLPDSDQDDNPDGAGDWDKREIVDPTNINPTVPFQDFHDASNIGMDTDLSPDVRQGDTDNSGEGVNDNGSDEDDNVNHDNEGNDDNEDNEDNVEENADESNGYDDDDNNDGNGGYDDDSGDYGFDNDNGDYDDDDDDMW